MTNFLKITEILYMVPKTCYNEKRDIHNDERGEPVVAISPEQRKQYLTKAEASIKLGCSISSIEQYVRQFQFETFRLPLDRRAYLNSQDVEYIKRLKEAARDVPALNGTTLKDEFPVSQLEHRDTKNSASTLAKQ